MTYFAEAIQQSCTLAFKSRNCNQRHRNTSSKKRSILIFLFAKVLNGFSFLLKGGVG